MRIYRTTAEPSRRLPNLVVGIGNFDGVHLGHLKIIDYVKKGAGENGTPGIIIFSPHTRAVLGESGEENLTTLPQKLEIFRRQGLKTCWVINFDRRFSHQAPRSFAREILSRRLGIRGVVVGERYRFGRARGGDVRFLKKMGADLGFWVREVAAVKVRGTRVSSSFIRRMIGRGEVGKAAFLLGRDYCLSGMVVRGSRRARRFGYPTANFFPEQLMPRPGVYAAWILFRNQPFPGMIYLGRRPTIPAPGLSPLLAEAHLFDFRGSLYRRRIKVFLKKRLRGDIKFRNVGELFNQIKDDEVKAKAWLKRMGGIKS